MGNICNKNFKKPQSNIQANQTQQYQQPLISSFNVGGLPNIEKDNNNNIKSAPPPPPLFSPEKVHVEPTPPLKNTPQEPENKSNKQKEYWELKSYGEIFEKLTSLELNEALKNGENLKIILDLIPFEENLIVKELTLNLLEKILEDSSNYGLGFPETLSKILLFIKQEVFEGLKQYLSNLDINENSKEFKEVLLIIVDFYQMVLCFIYKNITNPIQKWWSPDKNDNMFEIYYFKFREILDKNKGKREATSIETEENLKKSPKQFLNVDIEQEFMKVGDDTYNFVWEKCEVTEEMEGITLKIQSHEYFPKVKRKKSKKAKF